MKKIIIIPILLIVIILAALLILPYAFKGKISDLALQKANESVNATIKFDKYSLSLLRTFPDFNASFSGVSVIGIDNFEGDTLLALGSLNARIDIKSVFNSETLLIKSIEIEDALLQLIEKENQQYNWSIEKSNTNKNEVAKKQDTTEKKNEKTPKAPLKLLLQKITLSNFDFIYNSRAHSYNFSVFDMNAQLTGEMTGLHTLLDVRAQSPSLNFRYDDINYISKGKVDLHTQLDAKLETYEFTFKQGVTELNGLPMLIEGGFAMPGDSMFFDIDYDVNSMDMGKALELIPDVFLKYMKDIEAEGQVALNGFINGVYYKNEYPAFEINFDIEKGLIKYPQLPDQLQVHKLNASARKEQGGLDLLEAGITQFDMQLAENPFSMHARFSNLFSDPLLDIVVDGIVDLESLARVVPLGDTKMRGLLIADAAIIGNYSALNNNDFDSFLSEGKIELTNLYLQNSILPQGLNISKAAMVLQNQDIRINGLNGFLGKSDFSIKGELNNFVKYIIADELLSGTFTLESQILDLNEFMASYVPEEEPGSKNYIKKDTVEAENNILELPKNLFLTFNANVSRMYFDQMNISDFNGRLELNKQQLTLKGLNMNMLGGQMGLNGTVLADGRENPRADFNLNISNFDLPSAHAQLSMVQRYLPFASQSQGAFSSRLNVNSAIDNNLKMILTSLTANGDFSTQNLSLVNASVLSNLNQVIQTNKLRHLKIDDFRTIFSIKDGNLNIQPFSTKVAEQAVSMGGTYNLGGTINMKVDATLEKQILAPQVLQLITYIPGHQNIKTIDVGMNIKGDAKKPEVTIDNDKIRKQVMDQLRNSSQKDIEDAAKKIFRDLFN
jgi:hypothetical protein